MNCNELLAKKSCKNKAKEKFVRTQTDGWFLYLDIKKVKKDRYKTIYKIAMLDTCYFLYRKSIVKLFCTPGAILVSLLPTLNIFDSLL